MDDRLLLGELREFKRVMTSEMKEIKGDIKFLMRFHWKLMGMAAGAGFLGSFLVHLVRH